MEFDTIYKRLETWKQILYINFGASITLLATGIADLPNISKPHFPGWYGVWFVVQLACLLPGFVLLWGRYWVQIPLNNRLNIIFGFFITAWITILSFGLKLGKDAQVTLFFFLFGSAIIISMGYWWLRRKSIEAEGEMFP